MCRCLPCRPRLALFLVGMDVVIWTEGDPQPLNAAVLPHAHICAAGRPSELWQAFYSGRPLSVSCRYIHNHMPHASHSVLQASDWLTFDRTTGRKRRRRGPWPCMAGTDSVLAPVLLAARATAAGGSPVDGEKHRSALARSLACSMRSCIRLCSPLATYIRLLDDALAHDVRVCGCISNDLHVVRSPSSTAHHSGSTRRIRRHAINYVHTYIRPCAVRAGCPPRT